MYTTFRVSLRLLTKYDRTIASTFQCKMISRKKAKNPLNYIKKIDKEIIVASFIKTRINLNLRMTSSAPVPSISILYLGTCLAKSRIRFPNGAGRFKIISISRGFFAAIKSHLQKDKPFSKSGPFDSHLLRY
jgi:hypothetical protein